MRTIFTKLSVLLSTMICMVLVACNEGPYYGNARLGSRDHSDAVVNINQVDPEYRKYFEEQHGADYSVSAQREAFFAAVKTSKTPVQQDAQHMARNAQKGKKASSKKSSSRSKSKKKVVKRTPAKSKSKAKTTSKKKTATKSKSKSKKR